MSILVRPATEADVSCIIRLYDEFSEYISTLESGGDPEGSLTADTLLRDGFGHSPAFAALVAEIDCQVIGYLFYHFGYSSELAGRLMYIMDLYVAEQHRREGVGTSLMSRAESVCDELDVLEIVWSVYKPNRAAREFYEHLGAKLIDDEDYMYLEIQSQGERNQCK